MNVIDLLTNNFLYKKYRLYKINQLVFPVNFDEIKKLEKICNSEISAIKNSSSKYLKKFINVINANFDKSNLHNFYTNYATLKIVISKRPFNKFSLTSGVYNSINNTVKIINNIDNSIYHELLHVSSCRREEKNMFTGFHYTDFNISIGYGINEGYTELLTKRYFNTVNNCYLFETIVCKYIEKIVGKDLMETFYLNGDLYSLIHELSKYTNKTKIMNFLSRMDYYTNRGNNVLTSREALFSINQINSVISFLLDTFVSKLKLNKALTKDEIRKLYHEYSSELAYEYDMFRYNGNEKSK